MQQQAVLSRRICHNKHWYKFHKGFGKGRLNGNLCFRPAPGTISCPVCLDSYCEVAFLLLLLTWMDPSPAFWWGCWCLQIVDSGRLVVSTKCGHVFCSQCLRDALTSSHTCPTCRKRLTRRQYHPLYIWPQRSAACRALLLTIYNLTGLNDCQLMHIIDYSSYSLFFVFSNCVNKLTFWGFE